MPVANTKLSARGLLTYIKDNPKCTNTTIAKAHGLDASSVAARTKGLFDQGRVTREVVGRTASGVAVFGYSFKSYDTVEQVKRERQDQIAITPAPTPKKTQDNVSTTIVPVVAHAAPKPKAGQPDADVSMSIQQSLSALASSLAETIVRQVQSRLAVELSTLIPEPVAPLPTMQQMVERLKAPPVKDKKPKVIVTGLLPQQEGVIAQEFNDVFDLSFWNDRTGGTPHMLKDRAKHCDVVFHHTAHSSHATEEVIKQSGAKFVRVGGGITSMKDAMLKYYCDAS